MESLRMRSKKTTAPRARPVIGGPVLQVRAQDRDKVADLVKRRQSVARGVINISSPLMPGGSGLNIDAPPVPALPTGPVVSAKQPYVFGKSSILPDDNLGDDVAPDQIQTGAIDVVLSDFQRQGFNASNYVSHVLRDATENEVREYQLQLRARRARASTELQSNVYVNRAQFIMISKEIDHLKDEMRSLRNLLGELDATTSSLKISQESSPVMRPSDVLDNETYTSTSSRYDRQARNSIADLTQLWQAQLRLLWERVENSQKFLPAQPGRHIVMDSPNWVELNSATWKPMRQIHMFLLNDNLLVASLKKRRPDAANKSGPPTKLFAENCWPLSEIEVVDLAPTDSKQSRETSSKEIATAINIRAGKESFVYRSDKPEKKIKLLITFKKTHEEFRKAQRAETEDQNRIRDNASFFAARDPSLQDQGELLRTLSTSMSKDRQWNITDADGKQRNLRWLENQIDELDEVIAHHNFQDAVSRVETLREVAQKHVKTNSLASEYITIKMDERALRLANLVTTQLTLNAAWKSNVRRNVSWLLRLGFEDRARDAFLEARSAILKKRTRQVRFEGDIPSYISQIALVQFTLIRNTVDIYNSCFEYKLSSPLVRWAKEHVEAYSDLLTRQLSAVDPTDEIYDQCVKYTQLHSTMLAEVGLDFKDQLAPKH